MRLENRTDLYSEGFVWIFNAPPQPLSGGIFTKLTLAEKWIKINKLSGVLSKYPLNEGVLDWAIRNNLVGMKPEKLNIKKDDPYFIAGFTTASMEHYHYKNGKRD